MDKQKVFELINQRKDELFNLLSSLIKIESENHWTYGNEKNVAEYIFELCTKLGLETDMYSPLDIEGFTNHSDFWEGKGGKHLEDRPNVTARWRGEDGKDKLCLMAHTDTVEAGDRANWEFDPFSGMIKDGRVYGRGATDDKYAVAAALFIIKILKELGFKPKSNLIFTAYVDEEHGGSHGALAGVLKYPCEHIVSMDGREDQIWHCGSGGGEASIVFHTKETVDSAYITASALPIVIEEVEKFAQRRRSELEANPFYKGTIIPQTALRYMDVHAGNHANDLGVGSISFVYYTDKPKDVIDREIKEMEDAIRAKLEPMGIELDGFNPDTRFFHYVHTEPDAEDVLLMVKSAREAGAKEPLVCGSCLSDLSVISKFGSSKAYGFGAGRDFSLPGGAHQPNEFIECDKFVDYTKTIAAYIMNMLG